MRTSPNLFLVGAPKCGTSAMRSYLAQHPEVFFSVPDEPGFFDGPLRYIDKSDYHFPTIDSYLDIFQGADPSRHRVIAEGSVYTMYEPHAIYRILELEPNARFLIMLRDPIEGLISMHGENLKSPILGREPCLSIEAAWNDRKNRAIADSIAGVHPFRFRYDAIYSYYEAVRRTLEVAGVERVKVILYEDFQNSNIEVFREVCAFLEIDQNFRPKVRRVNERSQARDTVFAKFIGKAAIAARKYTLLKPFRGRGLSLNRLTQKPLDRPVLPPSFRKELEEFFADDIAQLSALIKRELSEWR